jgi:hypothetical protein
MEEMQLPELQVTTAGLDLAISQKIGDAISNTIINPELASNFPEPPDTFLMVTNPLMSRKIQMVVYPCQSQ